MGIEYWLDVTDYNNIKQEKENSNSVVAIIVNDNLSMDEAVKAADSLISERAGG